MDISTPFSQDKKDIILNVHRYFDDHTLRVKMISVLSIFFLELSFHNNRHTMLPVSKDALPTGTGLLP